MVHDKRPASHSRVPRLTRSEWTGSVRTAGTGSASSTISEPASTGPSGFTISEPVRTGPSGFTIVELLITIVIIGILAGLTLIGYRGVTNQARFTKANHDLSELASTIDMARTKTNKTLYQITGNTSTVSACQGMPAGTDLSKRNATTESCWANYLASLKKISDAAGADITGLKDPFGRPYWIDENEGDPYIADPCTRDAFSEFSMPFKGGWSGDAITPNTTHTIPTVSPSCGGR